MSFESWKRDIASTTSDMTMKPTSGFEAWKKSIDPPEADYTSEMIDLAYDKYVQDVRPLAPHLEGFSWKAGGGIGNIVDKQTFIKNKGPEGWIRSGATRQRRSYKENMVEANKRGLEDFKIDQAYSDAVMFGTKVEQDQIYKQWKIKNAREQLDPIGPDDNRIAKMSYGTARILPGMMEGTKQAIPFMIGGAVLAGVGGAAVPFDEVVTVPAAIGIGWKMGSTYAWYKQGAGQMMLAMREKGMDDVTSQTIANFAAIPYALIEQLQIGQLTPGVRTAANKAISKSMTKIMGKAAKKYAVTLGSEVGEEILQEGVGIIAEDLASYFHGQGIDVSVEELKERAFRLWNTAKGSVEAMALLPIPGAAIDIRTGYKGKQLVGKIEDAGYNKKQAVSMANKIDMGMPTVLAHREVVAETIADQHKKTGGSTISQQSGRSISKGFPINTGIQEIIEGEQVTTEQVLAFEAVHADELGLPNRQMSTRYNEAENKTYFDVVQIAETQEEAMELGIKHGEVAITNLETGEVIQLKPEGRVAPKSTTEIPDFYNTMALAQEYGLGVEDVQQKLDNAELRFRELSEKKELSPQERREQRFLATYRKNPKALLNRDTGPAEGVVLTKKQIMDRAHNLSDLLGYDVVRYRARLKELTGKESMKSMVPAQREQVMMAFEQEAKEAGMNIEGMDVTPVGELMSKLRERKQKPALTNRDRRMFSKLRTALHDMKRGVSYYFLSSSRMRRVAKALDNYQANGPFSKYIFNPVRQADAKAVVNFTATMEAMKDSMDQQGIDAAEMITEVKDIGIEDQLTTAERIGVYALSKNEKTYNHLTAQFEEDEIAKIISSVESDEKEMAVAAEISAYFEYGWPEFEAVVKAVGLKGPVKEDNYIAALITDRDEIEEPDFMQGLTVQFTQEGKHVPGEERAIERKPGAKRQLELDIFAIHARAARSIERFKVMAPVAAKVGSILKHRGFKNNLNRATYGHGAKLFSKWLEDSIRGKAAYDSSKLAPMLRWFRKSSMNYVLGYKLLTAGKQGISALTGMTVDPKMIPLVLANMYKAGRPAEFNKMYAEASGLSTMLKTRDWDRDLRQVYDRKAIKRLYQGKKLSPVSMRMAAYIDKRTSTAVWYSAYQLSLSEGMNKEESVQFADGVLQDTQPMASAVDLPAFFRGGEFEKTLTIFQNQVNQNGNILWYDILGEAKSKKINYRTAAYRTMMSQILPAYLLGMITRGRPTADPKEIAKDIASFMLSPLVFVGRLVYNIAAGDWGPSGSIITTPFAETGRLVRSIKQGDVKNTAKYAARSAGAWSGGKIPLQVVTSAEGAYNLATGDTDDFRELVWSKYALRSKDKSKKSKQPEVKY